MRRAAPILIALACAACADAEPARPPAEPRAAIERPAHSISEATGARVVARIDEREITVLDVADEIDRQRGSVRSRAVMPASREELLDHLLRDELLADEARRRGLDDEPSVVRARRAALRERLAAGVRAELAHEESTDEELRELYGAHPEHWAMPERVVLRYLALPDRALAEEVLAAVRSAARPDHELRDRAEEHRWDAPGLPAYGELGPFARPELHRPEDAHVPRALAEAGFASEAGELHPGVVESDGVFFVVQALSRDPETRIAFEEARPHLRALALDAAVEARLRELAFAGHHVFFDDGALASALAPHPNP